MVTTSEIGPKTTMPMGRMVDTINCCMPNTRPCISGSTISCSSVVIPAFHTGMGIPARNITIRYSVKCLDSPSPTKSSAQTMLASPMVRK